MAEPAVAPSIPKPQTRTGRCIVCTCEAYEHDRVEDGFRTCACHHTQWGHREPTP